MPQWSVHIESGLGALRNPAQQRTFECAADRICDGVTDVLKLWAATAPRHSYLTVTVRRTDDE